MTVRLKDGVQCIAVSEVNGELASAAIAELSDRLWSQVVTLNPPQVLNSTAIRISWQVRTTDIDQQMSRPVATVAVSTF